MTRCVLLPLVAATAVAACGDNTIGTIQGELFVTPSLRDLGARPVAEPTVFYLNVTAERANVPVSGVSILDVASPVKRFFTLSEWENEGFTVPEDVKNADLVIDNRHEVTVQEPLEWPFIYYSESEGYHRASFEFQYAGRGGGSLTTEVRAQAATPDLAIYPWTVDFGWVPVGGRGTAFVTIENRSNLPLFLSSRFRDRDLFETLEPEVLEIEPQGTHRYEVVYAPISDDPVLSEVTFLVGEGGVGIVRLRANDCENGVPSAYDKDGDGFTTCAGDCDDTRDTVKPGAPERADGLDNDCDGRVDNGLDGFDNDGDGFCAHPTSCYEDFLEPGDCHDGDPAINPDARENCPSDAPECSDGIDNDCDGTADGGTEDSDGDGYTEEAGDCAPEDGTVAPGKPEIPDGKDNDCDGVRDEGTVLYDDDGDGFCEGMAQPPPGVLPNTCSNVAYVGVGDCDDSVDPLRPAGPHPGATIYPATLTDPGAPEWSAVVAERDLYFGIDNDCDGEVDEDTRWADDDGDGYTDDAGDCDDADPTIGPFALERPGNGVDEDCNPDTPGSGPQ